MPSSVQSVTTIDNFLTAVGGQVKVADGSTPRSEPGSIGGETEHPVKKVDDRLQDAPEGERFKENTKDVKEDQGKPSAENAPEVKAGAARRAANIFDVAAQFANGRTKKAEGGAVSTPGSAEDDQLNIGTKAAPTGEDPAVETASAKAGKEDPGSKHPARTDNSQIDGHKWAAAPLEQLSQMMKEAGDNLCAQLNWVLHQGGGQTPAQGGSIKQAAQQDIDPYLAQQLGWEMAGLVNGTFDKQAADSLVVGTLEQIVKEACDDADRYINYMYTLYKQAEGEDGPPDVMGGGGNSPPPPPGGDPTGGAASAGAPGPDAMMSALGGGAPAGGPGGAAGGPGGAAGGPDGGMGGGAPDAEVMQLAQILEQMGISSEELEQALQQQEGGGMGGGPPPGPGDGGASPGGPAGGSPPGGGMETAASDRGQHKQAASDKVAATRDYIMEIVRRSRSRK